MRIYPPLVPFRFVYIKNDVNLRFTCPASKTDHFDLKLHMCRIHMKRIELYPSILNELEQRLSNSVIAKYYIHNQYVRVFSVEASLTEKRIPNILLNNYLPSYMIICFLETKDLKGHRQASNFNFQHFGITNLHLQSGAEIYPVSGPFTPDFKTDENDSEFKREFSSIYGNVPAGLGLKTDSGSWLKLDDFMKGFAFFKIAFNRLGDTYMSHGSYLDQRKHVSSVDLNIQFKTALVEPISAVIFTSYLEFFTISKTESSLRDVQLGYSL